MEDSMFQSTHSRGVRHFFFLCAFGFELFQSTHSRGVRLWSDTNFRTSYLFQSTHSRGVRHHLTTLFSSMIVSIHALTRSATFNLSKMCVCFCRFQSTHSRGVRLDFFCPVFCFYICFNPRTHEECDDWGCGCQRRLSVSIHALTRSATHRPCCFRFPQFVSIHALTRSATT